MAAGSGANSEKSEEKEIKSFLQTPATHDQDFSPQLKRLRTPQSSPSPRSRFGGKRRSATGAVSSGSPGALMSFMAPRKLSEPEPSMQTWNCGACTYSNSSLLPYCEMCEFPRSSSAAMSGTITKRETNNNKSSHLSSHNVCVCAFLYFYSLLIHKLHFPDCKTNWIPLRKRQQFHHLLLEMKHLKLKSIHCFIFPPVNINRSSLLT